MIEYDWNNYTAIVKLQQCSVPVKLALFKTYCMNLYDIGLWHTYMKGRLLCRNCVYVVTSVLKCF